MAALPWRASTCRYGKEVHEGWADAGLAPKLLAFEQLPGGWFMVIMQQLGAGWQLLSSLATGESKKEARRAALCALQQAHTLEVFGPSCPRSVHGDARDTNVMVATTSSVAAGDSLGSQPGASSSNKFSVRFVDFDWAGQDGVDRYPLLMSTYIPWPEGAGDQLLMRQCHDVALLSIGGAGSKRNPLYLWRGEASAAPS